MRGLYCCTIFVSCIAANESPEAYEKGVQAYEEGNYIIAKGYFISAGGYEDSKMFIDLIDQNILIDDITSEIGESDISETIELIPRPAYEETSETVVTTTNPTTSALSNRQIREKLLSETEDDTETKTTAAPPSVSPVPKQTRSTELQQKTTERESETQSVETAEVNVTTEPTLEVSPTPEITPPQESTGKKPESQVSTTLRETTMIEMTSATTTPQMTTQFNYSYQDELLKRTVDTIKAANKAAEEVEEKIRDVIARGGAFSSIRDSYDRQLEDIHTDIYNLEILYHLILETESNEELLELRNILLNYERVY